MLELVRQNYRDFGPTLAAEVLLERHYVDVSRETVRKWMAEAGLWLSRKQRRTSTSRAYFARGRIRRQGSGRGICGEGLSWSSATIQLQSSKLRYVLQIKVRYATTFIPRNLATLSFRVSRN